jgi:curli biogenesis system outer membrane secretion channel CsgG
MHMKRLLGLSLVCAVLAGAIAIAPAAATEKPRIAVLEFEGKAHADWWSWWHNQGAGAAQDVFVTQLVKSGKFRVIEREKLNALLAEKDLALSGAVDTRTAVQAGKLLGVKYFLTGALTAYGSESVEGHAPSVGGLPSFGGKKNKFHSAMNARIIDTETGEIVWADEASGTSGGFKLRIGGFGGGKTKSPGAHFDKALKPIIEQLAGSIKAADL